MTSNKPRKAPDPAPLDLTEPEQPAIDDQLSEELEKYKGRWVAVFNKQIVASGDSAVEVTKTALEKGITDPLVFRVPSHPERINYL